MGTYDPMPAFGDGTGPGTNNTGDWSPWLRALVADLDNRLLVGFAHNPLLPAYGALGNSNHTSGGGADDTVALQAAITAAQASGSGFVPLMGGRTYRHRGLNLCPDLTKSAVEIRGFGSFAGNRSLGLPCLLYDDDVGGGNPSGGVNGGGDGIVSRASGNNLPNSPVSNVNIRGLGTRGTGAALRMGPSSTNNAKLDSNTYLENVFFQNWVGDAFVHDGGGATNFRMHGGRWDAVGGYAINMTLKSHSTLSIRDVTYDNNSPAGGASKGFALFDASAIDANGYVALTLDHVHTENQWDLTESDAAGSRAADKCGMIQLAINPSVQRTQFRVKADQMDNSGWAAGRKSFSFFQVLGGTLAQRRARVSIAGDMWSNFGGDGTASTGHALPIGNTGDTPSPIEGWYPRVAFYPGGDNLFSTETSAPWTVSV